LDELARVLDQLSPPDQELLAVQAASQLPIPNKLNAPKIINLLQRVFTSPVIAREVGVLKHLGQRKRTSIEFQSVDPEMPEDEA
jgi:hypothetical protein